MSFEQHIFLSDVHLGAFSAKTNKQIEEDLLALIEYCKQRHIELHILGDLFDYWMEFPEKGFVPQLGKNETVSPALFVTGNHDNWTFGHFKERGFDLEENFRLKEINGKRFLLMHGDGVAAAKIDFPRAAFHQLLRHSNFVNAYQKVLPPATGLALMKKFSSLTRRRDNHNPEPLNRQAKKIFSRHRLDYIITGHDHVPRVETFPQGRYINCGPFFNKRTLVLHTKDDTQLVTWNAEDKNFIPFG